MILTDTELKRIDNGNYYGDLVILRDVEAAVIAKLAAWVSVEPAYWRNQVDSYSVLSSEDKEKNSFQYSDEFLEGHTDPLYTADQLRTAIAAARVRALEDAAEEAYLYLGGGSASTAIRALKGTPWLQGGIQGSVKITTQNLDAGLQTDLAQGNSLEGHSA